MALIAASSLVTSVGAASAADLDQISEAVDLAALAELILSEYLDLGDRPGADAQDDSYALAIGFTFGVAFSSDTVAFADALSEGLVLTGTNSGAFADLATFANALTAPGMAGVATGLDAVAFDPPGPPLVLQVDNVSPD